MTEQTELVTTEPALPMQLLGGETAMEKLAQAQEMATALSDFVKQKKLFTAIGGKRHVHYEAWTTLGAMLGVFPFVEWTRPVENGWEARVVVKTLSGAEVGASEAECLSTEQNWKGRDDYALRSMAQTRAASKALRMPLGFIMTLAGFDATPAAEMISKQQELSAARSNWMDSLKAHKITERTAIEKISEKVAGGQLSTLLDVLSFFDAENDATAYEKAREVLEELYS